MTREATLTDLPRLVEMGRHFLAASYRDTLTENLAQMATLAEQLVTQDNGTILVLERDGILVGMIGMLIFPHHLSAERTAGEVMWWIEPDARGAGIRLLKEAEQWARDHGARKIQMIAPNARVGQLYARLGYAQIEIAFQKDVA